MATRGVNGAASDTLNARFIKCAGCNVNVPKEDMLALGQCTVCGRPYEAKLTADGSAIQVATVAFGASAADTKPRRKRWAVLTSKKGRTYYHNSETGEDRWDKPADLDADAAEDAFVPFKNDAVKKAVLREQAKLEATKMGVPIHVVEATQKQLQHQDEEEDPFSKMVGRGTADSAPGPKRMIAAPVHEAEAAEQSQAEPRDTSQAGGSCVLM